MAVSKSKRVKALKRSAELIKGRATRGTWFKSRKKGSRVYGDRSVNYQHEYDALKNDPAAQLMFGPNSDVECKMCMEGAIYTACALEGIDFFDAVRIVGEASKQEFGDPGHIPSFNDHTAKNVKEIEARLAKIANDAERAA